MRKIKEREGEGEWEELKKSKTVRGTFSEWHPAILAWCLFLVIGSFHNATQVSILELAGLRASQIGLVLMFWGVGGFLAFVFPQRLGSFLSLPLSVMIFTIFLSLYLTGWPFLFSSACMMICGFFYSFIIGEMRAEISSLVKEKSSSLLLWAFVGKRSAWLQFYVYLLLMFSLEFFPPEFSTYVVCLLGFFLSYLLEKKFLTKRV